MSIQILYFLKINILCLWRVLRILHKWIQAFCQIYDWQIFVISLSWYCPLKHESFKISVMFSLCSSFSLWLLMLLMSYLRNRCLTWGCECFSSEFPNHWTCSGPWTVRNQAQSRRWAAPCAPLHSHYCLNLLPHCSRYHLNHAYPFPICGKIVFRETSPWCQKGWDC